MIVLGIVSAAGSSATATGGDAEVTAHDSTGCDSKRVGCFDDVPVGFWAEDAIGWAVTNNITAGVGGGLFGPHGFVTRAQAVTFLYRTVHLLHDSAASGDGGGKIVFSSDRTGSNQIFVMNADGTGVRQITGENQFDQSPVWSPDGTQILFSTSRGPERGVFKLFVMNADGTNLRQLTTGPGTDIGARWSSDGHRIAFSSILDGDREVFVMNADGTDIRQLTDNDGNNSGPVWSPDGTQIVFGSDRDGDHEVFVVNADGTVVRQLTHNDDIVDFPTGWSPDGSQVAFVSDRDGDMEVFVMNADGTSTRQLTNHPGRDLNAGWSPDGTQVLFQSDRDGDMEVFVMNADGTQPTQLTNNTHREGITTQAWSSPTPPSGSELFDDVPAGHWTDEAIGWAVTSGVIEGVNDRTFDLYGIVSRAEVITMLYRTVRAVQGKPVTGVSWLDGTLVYSADVDGDDEIFAMNADGISQLTNNTHSDISPAWSPDSTKIAFQSDRDGDYEIFVMNADGTQPIQLTNNTRRDSAPNWSPSGRQIVFTTNRGRRPQVVVMNADGTRQRQLTKAPSINVWPVWSPDGKQIVFQTDQQQKWEISVINADGTNLRRIAEGNHGEHPTWSPDGTRLVFNRYWEGYVETIVTNADGTNPQQLTSKNDNPTGIGWSPDGTQLVYGSGNRTTKLFIMNADGTHPQRLTDDTHSQYITAQAWSPNSPPHGSEIFNDVPEGHHADRPIGWAHNNSITSQTSQQRFDPNGNVTRAQIITYLHRLTNLPFGG